jgi:hypothetical protein
MTTPQGVLDDVADSLDQVGGLRCHSKTPGQVTPPAAVCELDRIVSPSSFGTTATYRVRVVLMVQVGDQRNSQERTLGYIDPTGAVTDSAFAALLDYAPAQAVTFEGPGLVEYGGTQYAGGIFTVEVIV